MSPILRSALLCLAVLLALAGARPGGAQTLAELARLASLRPTPGVMDGVFGSLEFRSEDMGGLPRWQDALRRMARDGQRFDACLEAGEACADPTLARWRRVVTAAAGLSRMERLRLVNALFNTWPYRSDPRVYGKPEYWAGPAEFMIRSGDCEDFAIIKYFTLRRLGFSPASLRIVVLEDQVRGRGHAVLAVYQGRDILILDSLSDRIRSHRAYRHYHPLLSMNEVARWTHIGWRKGSRRASYARPALGR